MKNDPKSAKNEAQKEPVRLRERVLANGERSLYLDIYRDGKRSREFLKLYLVVPRTAADREQNKETLATAQAIKSKRQIEIQNGEYSFTKQFKEDTNFLDYYRQMCEERHGNDSSHGNWGNWYSCLKHLEAYCDPHTTFRDITPEWIQGFKDYLDNVEKDHHKKTGEARSKNPSSLKGTEFFRPLSQNSKQSYFNKLRACINHAFEHRIIAINPLRGIEGYKTEEVKRAYLTLDEIKALAKTPCRYPWLKNAFMFSCLTGLRKSDIEKLTWGELQKYGDYLRIVFRQKKTGGQEYLDISPQAEHYLGPRGEDNERVFAGFSYNSQTLVELRRWVLAAGITKDITFHCGRHTFAVLMLDLGTDIYTVSKLLGHRYLATTQVYAKIMDKKKQNAVSMIPDINE